MGYYVRIVSSTAVVPSANLQRVYDKMCALNVTHHDQKRGGSWHYGKKEASWFSWMPANYPEVCKDAQAIFEELGFKTYHDDTGNLHLGDYNSKTGQEDLFLDAIKHDCIGEIEWIGEDGARWTTVFDGENVLEAESPTKLLGC